MAYQTLEGQLADQELSRLLITTDLTKSDGTRLVAVRLLDTAGRRSALAGSLGSELLTRSLATGGLAGGLLGASHCVVDWRELSRDDQKLMFVVVDGCGKDG